jgi:hypothetical protein
MKTLELKTVGLLLLLLFLQVPNTAIGQRSIEISGGLGYTAVDLEAWKASSAKLSDWNQFMTQVYAQVFLARFRNIAIGGERGYQYFFWYEVEILDYDDVYTTRRREANSSRLLAIGRFDLGGNFFADLGGGILVASYLRIGQTSVLWQL